jgi:hypothetical protein
MNVLLSCVSENRPDWFDRVRSLVLSVREFGGELSEAPVTVNFVDDVAPEFARPLKRLGAEVRVVAQQNGRNPFSNKLRMLELHEQADFDLLVALDCDVVVVGDFSAQLSSERIGAKPADYDQFTDREWRRLFGALDIPLPARQVVATATGEPIYPYFNSGVLLVPRRLCEELLGQWVRYQGEILDLFRGDPRLIARRHQLHVDQLALACALQAGRLPYEALPVSVNFPTHIPVHASTLSGVSRPLILHYHGEISPEGFLTRSRSALADEQLDRFNRHRARVLGLPYSGLRRRPLRHRVRHRAVVHHRSLAAAGDRAAVRLQAFSRRFAPRGGSGGR